MYRLREAKLVRKVPELIVDEVSSWMRGEEDVRGAQSLSTLLKGIGFARGAANEVNAKH